MGVGGLVSKNDTIDDLTLKLRTGKIQKGVSSFARTYPEFTAWPIGQCSARNENPALGAGWVS